MKNPIQPIIERFSKEYRDVISPYILEILALINKGKSIEHAVNTVFNNHNINKVLEVLVLNKMVEASRLVYPNLKESVLKRYYINELNLSQKIVALDLQGVVTQELKTAMRAGKTFVKIAEELADKKIISSELPKYMDDLIRATRANISDKKLQAEIISASKKVARLAQNGAPNRRLKASYLDILDKAKRGSKKQFEKSVYYAMQEKARYNAERIARTEIARAHGITLDQQALNDSDVIGVKFLLTNRHKEYDVCDFHTQADFYSMGKGIYPKDTHPSYPFHPHCTCTRVSVYKGEAKKGEYKAEKAKEVFNSIPSEKKKKLFGASGARIYDKTGNWQGTLNNWNGHEKIIKKKIFNNP